jgi:hypothetical protein
MSLSCLMAECASLLAEGVSEFIFGHRLTPTSMTQAMTKFLAAKEAQNTNPPLQQEVARALQGSGVCSRPSPGGAAVGRTNPSHPAMDALGLRLLSTQHHLSFFTPSLHMHSHPHFHLHLHMHLTISACTPTLPFSSLQVQFTTSTACGRMTLGWRCFAWFAAE